MSSTRATGVAVLALGLAASASAVVPAFGPLHGNKAYLAITSLIGLAAAAAGVQMLITASGAGLTHGDGRDGCAVAHRHHPPQPPGQDQAPAAGHCAAVGVGPAATILTHRDWSA
jgi:hypothetical protein